MTSNEEAIKALQTAIDIIERKYCMYVCSNWFDGFCASDKCSLKTDLRVLKEMKKELENEEIHNN